VDALHQKNFTSPNKQVKRGPGRPPKSASRPNPPKKNTGRGRGRPPTSSKANLTKKSDAAGECDDEKSTIEMKDESNPKPLSSFKPVSPKKISRGRGRPPSASKTNKAEKKETKYANYVDTKASVSPVKVELTPKNLRLEKATKETGDMGGDVGKMEPLSPKVMKQNANEPKLVTVKDDGVVQKKNESFVSELSSRQNTKETEIISENYIKKAEAAAVEAVESAVKVSVDNTDGQKAQLSRSAPSTSVVQGAVDRGGSSGSGSGHKVPRRKPGARECMQISRRFGANIIPQNYMETLLVSMLYLYYFQTEKLVSYHGSISLFSRLRTIVLGEK